MPRYINLPRNMQRVNPREQRERPQDLHVDIVMVLEFGVMIALVSLVFQLLYNKLCSGYRISQN